MKGAGNCFHFAEREGERERVRDRERDRKRMRERGRGRERDRELLQLCSLKQGQKALCSPASAGLQGGLGLSHRPELANSWRTEVHFQQAGAAPRRALAVRILQTDIVYALWRLSPRRPKAKSRTNKDIKLNYSTRLELKIAISEFGPRLLLRWVLLKRTAEGCL